MLKEQFMELLNLAEEDEYGRLYIKNVYGEKVYFGIMETVCQDLFELNHYPEQQDTDELYDRHFWEEDTFEAHVISTKHKLDYFDAFGECRYPVLNNKLKEEDNSK